MTANYKVIKIYDAREFTSTNGNNFAIREIVLEKMDDSPITQTIPVNLIGDMARNVPWKVGDTIRTTISFEGKVLDNYFRHNNRLYNTQPVIC